MNSKQYIFAPFFQTQCDLKVPQSLLSPSKYPANYRKFFQRQTSVLTEKAIPVILIFYCEIGKVKQRGANDARTDGSKSRVPSEKLMPLYTLPLWSLLHAK